MELSNSKVIKSWKTLSNEKRVTNMKIVKCKKKKKMKKKGEDNNNIIGIVVLSTQHSCTKNCTGVFPIANNRDNSAFRIRIYVPLCRLHFGSDCNELFMSFEP